MDYIEKKRLYRVINIALLTQRVVYARRCSSVIILSVNAGNQR